MTPSPTETAVREFLVTEVFYDRDLRNLGVDDSLVELGLLDSLSILRTVTFCEEHFGVTVPDHEVLPDHFESVRAIAALVERLRAS
jgi:acyl carrier protein